MGIGLNIGPPIYTLKNKITETGEGARQGNSNSPVGQLGRPGKCPGGQFVEVPGGTVRSARSGSSKCPVGEFPRSVVFADRTSAVSADKKSVVCQDIPMVWTTQGGRLRRPPCVVNRIGMSWQTTDFLSVDTTDFLSADTTDFLSADTTDFLSTDTTDVLSANTKVI